MREIKVQLYSGEDDNYVELWKTVEEIEGKHRYYGRYTYGDEGTWYSVCDPLGYCELNAPIADDVMFICCDENGNEVIRYSNADAKDTVKGELVFRGKVGQINRLFGLLHRYSQTILSPINKDIFPL